MYRHICAHNGPSLIGSLSSSTGDKFSGYWRYERTSREGGDRLHCGLTSGTICRIQGDLFVLLHNFRDLCAYQVDQEVFDQDNVVKNYALCYCNIYIRLSCREKYHLCTNADNDR